METPAPSVDPKAIEPPKFVSKGSEKTDAVSGGFDSFMNMLNAPGDEDDKSVGSAKSMGSAKSEVSESRFDDLESKEPPKKRQKTKSNKTTRSTRSERNRIHARRARLRRKIFIQVLEKGLEQLREENKNLKSLLFDRFGINFDDVYSTSNLFASSSNAKMVTELCPPDFRLVQQLNTSIQSFVVSNPQLPDNPIIYVTEGFCKMTGYSKEEVLGRNCRFLQGEKTDRKKVSAIRRACKKGRSIAVCLLNYRKNGEAFWNYFYLSPLRDASGAIVMFLGVQYEVNDDDVKTLIKSGMADKAVMSERNVDDDDSDGDETTVETPSERAKRVKELAAEAVSKALSEEKEALKK